MAAGWLGRDQLCRKIIGSLQIDIQKTVKMLSWTPVMDVDEALKSAIDCNNNSALTFEKLLLRH